MSNSPLKKYFEKSAFKADREPRGKFREIRDAIKDDWHDVPRGSHYQGEDVRVFPEKEKAKQDAHDYLKSGGDMFDIAGAREYAKNQAESNLTKSAFNTNGAGDPPRPRDWTETDIWQQYKSKYTPKELNALRDSKIPNESEAQKYQERMAKAKSEYNKRYAPKDDPMDFETGFED